MNRGDEAGGGDWNQYTGLDALGNWDSVTDETGTQTRTHDGQNRITGVTGLGATHTPTYSANGEMTRDETGQTLKYDAWGRLVKVVHTDLPDDFVSYGYDALSCRIIERTFGRDNHLYQSQQWQVIEVRDRWGDTTAQHGWSPVYVDAMVLRDRDTIGDGSPDERIYVLHDANFNITALVGLIDPLMSGQWNVIERYLYDPYGERTVLDADWSADKCGISGHPMTV
jgi:YD repeat-containing protein